MKDSSDKSTQAQTVLEPGSFVSLKDYFVGEEPAPNPYASFDDFLDETWNLEVLSTNDPQASVNPSSYS